MSDDSLRGALESALGAQYDVGRLLGRGGAGAVYLATERLLERPVAIKVLHRAADDDASRQRFVREARTAARLSHPNIVPLLSFGESGEMLFYIMPYVDGESLESLLRRERRLHPADARRILADVAGALAYAHQRGVVHRDVKPDNILIERESGRALLTDFGIARRSAEGATITQTGMIVGTPHYMSPEQASGEREVDGRADVYALGVIGFRMLSGQLPFDGRTVEELLARRFTTDPPALTTIVADAPIDLASAIGRCLERDPAARWSDAASFRFAIAGGMNEADEVPDQLESLPRFGTRAVGMLYLTAVLTTALYSWDYDPAYGKFFGLCAATLVGGTAYMIARARRLGLTPDRALRLAFRPPAGWFSWWPSSLRSPDDVWSRLPRPVRIARVMVGGGLAGCAIVIVGGILGMILARHHTQLARVFYYGVHLSAGALVLMMIVSIVIVTRFSRAAGLDRYEHAKLSSERTSGSKFWSRPNIARLLGAESRANASSARHSPTDVAREMKVLVAKLADGGLRGVAEQAERVLSDLANRAAVVDRELQQLNAHHDPAERERLEQRLAALGAARMDDSPAITQMRTLLSSQLTFTGELAERQRDLLDRRSLLDEQARTLWLQVVRLSDEAFRSATDAEELTSEIRRLCDTIERRIEAAIETRRVTEHVT